MMLWENFKMALVSLGNAKLRSLLTMLGIIIGVSAVVSILAIGQGVEQSVQNEITGVVNANAIAITSGKEGKGGFSSALGASTLTTSDITALSKLNHVAAVAPISLVSGI
ncbi:MAG TPA: ABC transporter permease, partial [Candidatus Saccharimonadia bacterium]|nr:ABC transporter permease [Candidatus Saccharimonadia bacterium]